MEFLQDYFVIVIMAICFILGEIMKPYKFVNSEYLPGIMAIVGVIINVWINAFTFTPEILLGGLASGWASVGFYETKKNLQGAINKPNYKK